MAYVNPNNIGVGDRKTVCARNLRFISAQQVFDHIVNSLRKQKCKSLNENGKCVYRGLNGTKCAVGHLISDDEYDVEFDSRALSWDDLLTLYGFPSKHHELLITMQQIHDGCQIEEWEDQFRILARRYNLKYTEPVN